MERQKDEERTRFWKQNKVVWLVPYNHEKHVKKKFIYLCFAAL